MDRFYAILLKQQTEKYARTDLTQEDYEDIYYELTTMELPEAQPWILAMTYLGLGTGADPEGVLARLAQAPKGDVQLQGLYCDLQLLKDEGSEVLLAQLRQLEEQGFTAAYLKERSHAKNGFRPEWRPQPEKEPESEPEPPAKPSEPVPIRVREVQFFGDTAAGITEGPFLTGDVSYMHARILIDPIDEERTVHVRNQILKDESGEAFSEVFEQDVTLKAGAKAVDTYGWGNQKFTCYSSETVYRWEAQVDGITCSGTFSFLYGVNGDVKLWYVTPYTLVDGKKVPTRSISKEGNAGIGFRLEINDFTKVRVERGLKELAKKRPVTKQDRLIHEAAASLTHDYYASLRVTVRHIDTGREVIRSAGCQHVGAGQEDGFQVFTGIFKQENGLEEGLYEYSVSLGNGSAHTGSFTVV